MNLNKYKTVAFYIAAQGVLAIGYATLVNESTLTRTLSLRPLTHASLLGYAPQQQSQPLSRSGLSD